MGKRGPNRRDVLRGIFTLGATFAMPKTIFAQTSDTTTPKNPFLPDTPKTLPYDHVSDNPWPDPAMRAMFINDNATTNAESHSTNVGALNHVYYYDTDQDFTGPHYSGIDEVDVIDNHLIEGEWAKAYQAADKYLRSGALDKITDDALKIRVLSSIVVGLRWDGDERDYDPRHPQSKFPFDNGIVKELQKQIYGFSQSPIVLKAIFPPELDQAFAKMTKPGSEFQTQYNRVREITLNGVRTKAEAQERFTLTKSLNQKIADTMDSVYGTTAVPIMLDAMPESYSNLGAMVPVDTDATTASDFDKLATQHFGGNFLFINYSNPDYHDMLKTTAHEKLHDIQDKFVRDLEAGKIAADDPRFPLAQLYALNESLYSITDQNACNKNLITRCEKTRKDYISQPWEANSFSIEAKLAAALGVMNRREFDIFTHGYEDTPPPRAKIPTPNPDK